MFHREPIILLAIAALLCTSTVYSEKARASCAEVRRSFAQRQIGPLGIAPSQAITTNKLQICSIQEPTCCTRRMEKKYQQKANMNLQQTIDRKMTKLKLHFSKFVNSFQDDLRDLVIQSNNRILAKLNSTFCDVTDETSMRNLLPPFFDGFIAASNEETFRDVIKHTSASVHQFFQDIFALRFRKETGMRLSKQQLECVRDQFSTLSFFDNVTESIRHRLIRSLNQTEVLVQALKSGNQVLDTPSSSFVNAECQKALVRMQYCSHCYGLTLIKPCPGFCQNVISGCLFGFYQIDLYWEHYISGLDAMAQNMTSEGFDPQSTMSVILGQIDSATDTDIPKNILRAVMESCSISDAYRQKRSPKELFSIKADKHLRNHGLRNRPNRHASLRLSSSSRIFPRRLSPRRVLPPHLMLNGDSFLPLKVRKKEHEREDRRERKEQMMSESEKVILEPETTKLHLRSKLKRFVTLLNFTRDFFFNLPNQICGSHDDAVLPVSTRGNCWDGSNITDSYENHVITKGLTDQYNNPEVGIHGIDHEVKNAKENLRLSSKMLLFQAGKSHIPKVLLEPTDSDSKSEGTGTTKRRIVVPCGDDEDNCPGIGSGSGDDQTTDKFNKGTSSGNRLKHEETKHRIFQSTTKFSSTTKRTYLKQTNEEKTIEDGDKDSRTVFSTVTGKSDKRTNSAQGAFSRDVAWKIFTGQLILIFTIRILL